MVTRGVPGPRVPVYVISVAAELTGLHPQTLRTYDRIGLVSPGRTGGGGRRNSELRAQVAQLRAVLETTVVALQQKQPNLPAVRTPSTITRILGL